ncbi:Uncharacterized protein dnm_020050 [Desulfonema magnum]|uniref:Uncharacterized protein n=1 Tax=Desulfonema magnum TaxID=45655 RepID=A0A975BIJ5_9BACT|nr:Uncharacterized protein dnm_020050 [Desulfonema magnum]
MGNKYLSINGHDLLVTTNDENRGKGGYLHAHLSNRSGQFAKQEVIRSTIP